MRLRSLQGRLALMGGLAAASGALLFVGVTRWPLPQIMAALSRLTGWPIEASWLATTTGGLMITLLMLVPAAAMLGSQLANPLLVILRALEGAVTSYQDGDFGFSIAARRNDELGDLVNLHNDLGRTLREQRQNLTQRELMLDTMVQKSPQALVLVDAHEKVTYANIAARHLLNEGASMLGLDFADLCRELPESMRAALDRGGDSLFSVDMGGDEETFHVSLRRFRLQGRNHSLYLFRRMTRELSRQEVASWKRVIRVISHELNNSLAPIASMTHSGRELLARGEYARLDGVFDTIGERARHLHEFIGGYADFAKLPSPRLKSVDWVRFMESLALHCRFRVVGPLPTEPARFDPGQVEQILINLVKNAHEAGSPEDEVTLSIRRKGSELQIEVADRGPGMNEAVLSQALLPFYSTKRSGTGLGLALAREIAEAHEGRLQLANREHGGLRVTLSLPQPV
ncbi:MAG: ATP-binding protein [Rhodanobacteraceae bacterium]